MLRRLLTAALFCISGLVVTARPVLATHLSGCQSIVALLSKTTNGLSYSGYASGCYTSVSKRVCVHLVRGPGSSNIVSGSKSCSSYSTSSARQTATEARSCADLGPGDYQALAWVEVGGQSDGSGVSVHKLCP